MTLPLLDLRKSRLEDVLARLIEQAQLLIGLFDEESKHLLTPQPEPLLQMIKEKEAAVRELQRLSCESEDLKDALWQRLGERLPSPPFEQFLSRIGNDHAVRLKGLYTSLFTILKRLAESHHRNANLLRHALYYNRTLLEMIIPAHSESSLVDTRR